jgi:hypothetical protein
MLAPAEGLGKSEVPEEFFPHGSAAAHLHFSAAAD